MSSSYMDFFTQQSTHINQNTDSDNFVNKDKDSDFGVDFSFFYSEDAKSVKMGDNIDPDQTEEKKARKKRTPAEGSTVATVMVDGNAGLTMVGSTDPYIKSYDETQGLLKLTISQTDQISGEIKEDMDKIRSSSTVKNKYTYITNLTSSAATLLSTKIQAIKEINNSITQSHNLDLKRIKDLKIDSQDDKNDDMRIMEMYSAFVNSPIGTYNPNQVPSLQELTTAISSGNSGLIGVNMIDGSDQADMYNTNLSPEQNRMRADGNPNIKTVVMFNSDTGQRWFDVIDVTTGQSLPNIARPGDFLLEETKLDMANMIASNRNINSSWPLMLVGGNGSINEY